MADDPGPGDPTELQFDRAEYEQPAAPLACRACQAPLHDCYYDVNGAPICERCRHELALSDAGSGGAGARLGAALALGLLATLASSIAWYGIRKLTGYEFGILAIGVGLLVGAAVRRGARRRGGWKYQALAMFLTYNAIVVTYIPEIVEGFGRASAREPAASTPAAMGSTPTTAPSAATTPSAAVASLSAALPAQEAPSAGKIALGFLLLLAYAAPFLAVFQDPSALMGLVIIGIGLYEAWKLNRRVPLLVTGPHRIGVPTPAPAGRG